MPSINRALRASEYSHKSGAITALLSQKAKKQKPQNPGTSIVLRSPTPIRCYPTDRLHFLSEYEDFMRCLLALGSPSTASICNFWQIFRTGKQGCNFAVLYGLSGHLEKEMTQSLSEWPSAYGCGECKTSCRFLGVHQSSSSYKKEALLP